MNLVFEVIRRMILEMRSCENVWRIEFKVHTSIIVLCAVPCDFELGLNMVRVCILTQILVGVVIFTQVGSCIA